MAKNHNINNNTFKEGNMKNEHKVTAELEKLRNHHDFANGTDIKGADQAVAIFNATLRIIQGGSYNLVRPIPKSYYVRGRKLSELKPITKELG